MATKEEIKATAGCAFVIGFVLVVIAGCMLWSVPLTLLCAGIVLMFVGWIA